MLTLCILNYNGMDTLRESIQSVLDQTTRPDRFVVIDNASTDQSRQIAIDMGVEVVDADNRHKFITGLNVALNMCRDRLFFMQNDVVLERDCLRYMNSDCPSFNFMAQPVIYQRDGKIDNSGMDIFWPGYGQRRSREWWSGYPYEECGLVTTICFMIDRAALYPNRRFDVSFSPAYYEDLDFYLDKDIQTKHVLIPSAKSIHRGNHTFSQTLRKRQISDLCRKNRKKLIRKHYSGLDQMIRTAVLTVVDIAKEAFDVIRDRWVSANVLH